MSRSPALRRRSRWWKHRAIPGSTQGFVDLSHVTAPIDGQLNISLQGNDVVAQHVILNLHIIARYVLNASFIGNPTNLPASGLQGLQLLLQYEKHGTWLPYANRNVTVEITIYDGTLTYVSSINVTTRANGTIALVLPTIIEIRPRVVPSHQRRHAGRQEHQRGSPNNDTTPHNGPILGTKLRPGDRPRCRRHLGCRALHEVGCSRDSRHNATRKRSRRFANGEMEAAANRVKIQISEDRDALVDASTIRTSDTFSLVHMGPPDTIDIDMATIAGPQKTSKKKSTSTLMPPDGPSARKVTDKDLIDMDWEYDTKTKLTTALGKATEFEMAGERDEAAIFFQKAKEYALKLGNKDQVAMLEKKLQELE